MESCVRQSAAEPQPKGNTFSTRRNRVIRGNESQKTYHRGTETRRRPKNSLRLQTATFSFSDEHYWVEQLEGNDVTENVKNFFSGLEEFQG
jgi:hypothetical protein